jgi:hypothetical protein
VPKKFQNKSSIFFTFNTDEDTFWISGGYQDSAITAITGSSEYVTMHGESVPGPDLPSALSGHCAILWDTNTIFINGGYNAYGNTKRC